MMLSQQALYLQVRIVLLLSYLARCGWRNAIMSVLHMRCYAHALLLMLPSLAAPYP